MDNLIFYTGLILLICGICLLAASIISIKNIISILPSRSIRIKWQLLGGMICLFIIGYFLYAMFLFYKQIEFLDLVVTIVFFFGAIFVIVVNNLSYQAAIDVKRIDILEKENVTDSLMQIYNRRYFHDKLEQEIKRSERYTNPLSLLMIDIDHFKKVNDVHGHQTGDDVLIGIASVLRDNVRKIDIVARYGGEEMAVVLPETDKNGAYIIAERIRKNIENHSFDIDSGEKLSVSASLGVSSLEMIQGDVDDKLKQIIKLADDALYRAKKEGRNRVILYS